jgi:molybdopterin synthase sulfur carrier subunit
VKANRDVSVFTDLGSVLLPANLRCMTVSVRLFAAARAAAGVGEVQVDPGSLGTILRALESDYPSLAEVLPRCSYLVDGIAVHGDPDEVMVSDGLELDVLPPFAGG